MGSREGLDALLMDVGMDQSIPLSIFQLVGDRTRLRLQARGPDQKAMATLVMSSQV